MNSNLKAAKTIKNINIILIAILWHISCFQELVANNNAVHNHEVIFKHSIQVRGLNIVYPFWFNLISVILKFLIFRIKIYLAHMVLYF